jgi:glycosyltransferase involved in cell wall biosynthesis
VQTRPEGAIVPTTYGFLSTYPPTQCGLATFTAALVRNLATSDSGDRAGVVRVVDTPVTAGAPDVVAHLQTQAPASHGPAAEALNTFDVAIIQHEYGIFGGRDGDQLLAVLDGVRVPIVVVAHTVLSRPTAGQRFVLQQVTGAAEAVVTMTQAARDRLVAGYDVDPAKVVVIPHGAPFTGHPVSPTAGRRPLILTWGLLGPGKGIEWAIDSMQQLRSLRPLPAYIVAGQTHPRVRQRHGEAYRSQLGQHATAVDVSHMVRFVNAYLDELALAGLLARADVVLLPYDSSDQVTSGVLVEAVAAHKPVVATAFPHAVELLGTGAGLLVPARDPAAMGAALHRVLTDPEQSARMSAEAARLAPALGWPAVANRYRTLVGDLLAHRTPVLG